MFKTLTYQSERKSYAKAMLLLYLRRLAPMLLAVTALFVFVGTTPSGELKTELLLLLSVVYLVPIAMMARMIFQIYGGQNKLLIDAKRTAEFTEEKIVIEAEGVGHSDVRWEAFSKIEVVGDWTFVMQGRLAIVVVPDSAFATSEELAEFKKFMRAKNQELRGKSRT